MAAELPNPSVYLSLNPILKVSFLSISLLLQSCSQEVERWRWRSPQWSWSPAAFYSSWIDSWVFLPMPSWLPQSWNLYQGIAVPIQPHHIPSLGRLTGYRKYKSRKTISLHVCNLFWTISALYIEILSKLREQKDAPTLSHTSPMGSLLFFQHAPPLFLMIESSKFRHTREVTVFN